MASTEWAQKLAEYYNKTVEVVYVETNRPDDTPDLLQVFVYVKFVEGEEGVHKVHFSQHGYLVSGRTTEGFFVLVNSKAPQSTLKRIEYIEI